MEPVLTWPQIMTIVALIGAVAGLYRWISGELARERDERLRIERDLAAYKTFVSQNHVSAAALTQTEERLIAAVEKLATHLESVVARLDKLAIDMATKHVGTS